MLQAAKPFKVVIKMEIVKGVYQVEGLIGCNAYLVEDMGKLILIDTGMPGSDKKIAKAIQKLGYKLTDVSTIVLTHWHVDHVGSLKKMKEITNAKVAVHEADADFVAGKKPQPKSNNLLIRLFLAFVKAKPVDVDLMLKDGDRVGRLTVIHTPGHSEGSIALLDNERKVVIVGDTLFTKNDTIKLPPLILDSAKEKASLEKLSTFNFDIMLSGHGDPIMNEASRKLRFFLFQS
jgi:glyoxylase-like metal-dependent hydrolase (beta-lactamase superfamily II)